MREQAREVGGAEHAVCGGAEEPVQGTTRAVRAEGDQVGPEGRRSVGGGGHGRPHVHRLARRAGSGEESLPLGLQQAFGLLHPPVEVVVQGAEEPGGLHAVEEVQLRARGVRQ